MHFVRPLDELHHLYAASAGDAAEHQITRRNERRCVYVGVSGKLGRECEDCDMMWIGVDPLVDGKAELQQKVKVFGARLLREEVHHLAPHRTAKILEHRLKGGAVDDDECVGEQLPKVPNHLSDSSFDAL